jgi:hypothetical protein
MTKKDVTLSIEENLLKNAKKQIPNLSAFFEECLKNYMGIVNGLYPTAKYKEMLDEIGKIQTNLFLMNQNYDFEEAQKRMEDEKINRALRKLWNEYRKSLIADEQLMSEALEVLPTDAETLEDMLDFAYVNQEELGLNFTWNKLCELYETEEVE